MYKNSKIPARGLTLTSDLIVYETVKFNILQTVLQKLSKALTVRVIEGIHVSAFLSSLPKGNS